MSDEPWKMSRNGEIIGEFSLDELVESAARNGVPEGYYVCHPKYTKNKWITPTRLKPIREVLSVRRPAVIVAPHRRYRNGIQPAVASLLTLFLPGLGQFAQGRILAGAFVIVAVPLGYLLFIVPGLLFHLCAIIDCLANGEE